MVVDLSPIDVGTSAPQFEGLDPAGEVVGLAQLLGRGPLVLVFFPSAFSRICSAEVCEIRDEFADVADVADRVLGITTDSRFVLRAWSTQHSIRFRLVSDFWPHGEIAQRYGVFDATSGAAVRATFILDEIGVVRWRTVNPSSTARDHSPYRRVVQELLAAGPAS